MCLWNRGHVVSLRGFSCIIISVDLNFSAHIPKRGIARDNDVDSVIVEIVGARFLWLSSSNSKNTGYLGPYYNHTLGLVTHKHTESHTIPYLWLDIGLQQAL